MEQRSTEWFDARAGLFTASRFKAVLSKPSSETYKTLIASIVKERLIGSPEEVDAASLEWGRQNEGKALSMYRFLSDEEVSETGFHIHPKYDFCGASPDFLVGENGGGEIKCPKNSDIHIKTVINGDMPKEHLPQVQGNLWVTGREWWDFISFDPRLAEGGYFSKRIFRDDKYISDLERAILAAEDAVQVAMKRFLPGEAA